MGDRHEGECCRMCQFDKEDEDYLIEDDDGVQLCCCRALNDDGSTKPITNPT